MSFHFDNEATHCIHAQRLTSEANVPSTPPKTLQRSNQRFFLTIEKQCKIETPC